MYDNVSGKLETLKATALPKKAKTSQIGTAGQEKIFDFFQSLFTKHSKFRPPFFQISEGSKYGKQTVPDQSLARSLDAISNALSKAAWGKTCL